MSGDLDALHTTWAATCRKVFAATADESQAKDELDALITTLGATRKAFIDASAAEHEARVAYRAAIIASFHLKPGDIIRNARGKEAKIVIVEVSPFSTKVSMTLMRRRSDGTYGKLFLSDWQGKWNGAVLVERPASEDAT